MTRKASIAKLVYGRRDPELDNVTDIVNLVEGRKPRASKLRVSKLARRCPSCTRPLTNDNPKQHCDPCIARSKRKPRHADSVMEATVYANPKTRMTLYRAKGRLA